MQWWLQSTGSTEPVQWWLQSAGSTEPVQWWFVSRIYRGCAVVTMVCSLGHVPCSFSTSTSLLSFSTSSLKHKHTSNLLSILIPGLEVQWNLLRQSTVWGQDWIWDLPSAEHQLMNVRLEHPSTASPPTAPSYSAARATHLGGDVADVKAFLSRVALWDQLVVGDAKGSQRFTKHAVFWLAHQLPVLCQMLQQHSEDTDRAALLETIYCSTLRTQTQQFC